MIYAPIEGVAVIGLGHKARAGKDTMAQAIVRAIPGAVRYAFADDLRAYCRIVHGMVGKDAPLLQRIGVERREQDPEVWARSVYHKILEDRPRLAVISDVRFGNEAAMIRAMGGGTVRVTRYNEDGSVFVDPSRPADHVSETALDDPRHWDIEIENRGLVQLEQDAVAIAHGALQMWTASPYVIR